MHEHVATPLRLRDLADAAHLSPFHFDRIFRTMTGLSAIAFASALRINAAKQLLVSSDASVTDICFELGYESLGSFVSRFSRSVGVAPGTLRTLLWRDDGAPIGAAAAADSGSRPAMGGIEGIVAGDVRDDTLVWIGAFARGIPDGPPLAGIVVRGNGPFHIEGVRDGAYHVLALGLPHTTTLHGYLAPDARARVAKGGCVCIRRGVADRSVLLAMRPVEVTDPPVLFALPLLRPNAARSK